MLYAVVTALAALGSCYLLFRRGNAFDADVTSPVPLRRWTASLLAVIALNHLWYMPILFLSTEADIKLCDLLGGLLDCMTFFPLSVVVMLMMLQDRRRPLWPVFVAFAPLVVASAWCVVTRTYEFPLAYFYFLLLCVVLIIYMVREVRRYGRWLRDNFADLEHKEVWQSLGLLGVMLMFFVLYALAGEGTLYIYVLHTVSLVLVCYLPWRVDTLQDLETRSLQTNPHHLPAREEKGESLEGESLLGLDVLPFDDIEHLLQQRCEDTGLYLQHDLTLIQLAKCLGTNRTYLSMYFSRQGTTYNAYINDLRIDYFVRLVREANAVQRPITAQELATQSGYRNYRTFSFAFKQRMGQTVKDWMTAETTL